MTPEQRQKDYLIRRKKEAVRFCCICFLFAFFAIGLLAATSVVSAYMRAQQFNKLTGSSATTWDALWVDLRVQQGIESKL